MPLDFLSVKHQIEEQAARVPKQLEELGKLQARAEGLLADYANKLDEVRDKVAWALSADKNLRCALPIGEALDFTADCPEGPEAATIIAADGSQVYPSNHESVNYSVVNLGAIQFVEGSNEAPEIFTRPIFRLLEYAQGRQESDEEIDLERNKLERVFLAEIAAEASTRPVITLADGPLELWGAKSAEFREGGRFSAALDEYLKSLRKLQQMGAATAGYVAKPRASLVTRTLEILEIPRDAPEQLKGLRSLGGVSDLFLFGKRLGPGQRSAVFALQTPQKEKYAGALALHFFYLNLGTDKMASLARVEVPSWVVSQKELLDSVHALLFKQSRIFGTVTYPYVLHRAHEEAAIAFDMREQIDQMVADKLLALGITLDSKSAKQLAKDL